MNYEIFFFQIIWSKSIYLCRVKIFFIQYSLKILLSFHREFLSLLNTNENQLYLSKNWQIVIEVIPNPSLIFISCLKNDDFPTIHIIAAITITNTTWRNQNTTNFIYLNWFVQNLSHWNTANTYFISYHTFILLILKSPHLIKEALDKL